MSRSSHTRHPPWRIYLVLAASVSTVATLTCLPGPFVAGASTLPGALAGVTVAANALMELEADDFGELDSALTRIGTWGAHDPIGLATIRPLVIVQSMPVATWRIPEEDSGLLYVRAVDADSGAELDGLRVRAVGDGAVTDRWAEHGAFEVGLLLAPGAYSVLVLVHGYEPVELPAVAVFASEAIRLHPTPMRRGTGRILGTVGGAFDSRLSVELVGSGRRPCPDCYDVVDESCRNAIVRRLAWDRGSPCAGCGYTSHCTRVPLSPAGTFAFDRLSAGAYGVRVVDEAGHTLGLPVRIEMRAAELVHVSLQALRPRTVRVEVVDTDGRSLASTWARRMVRAQRQEEIETEVELVENLDWTWSIHAARARIATGALPLPPEHGLAPSRPVRRCGSPLGQEHDHPPAGSARTLWPPAETPAFAERPIEGEIDADGLLQFERMPGCEIELDLRCAEFGATVAVPAGTQDVRLRATLVRERVAGARGADVPVTFRDLDERRGRGPR